MSNNAMCNFFAKSKKSRNVNSLNGTVTLFNPDVMSRTVQTDTSFYVINYESPNEFTKNVLTICNIRPKYRATAN